VSQNNIKVKKKALSQLESEKQLARFKNKNLPKKYFTL
jgi:hypothetical protein